MSLWLKRLNFTLIGPEVPPARQAAVPRGSSHSLRECVASASLH